MEIEQALLDRITERVKTAPPVTSEVFVAAKELVVPVNYDSQGYTNVKVTRGIDSLSPAEITHLKFYPMVDDGYIVVLPAKKGEDGATEFRRSGSGRTGLVSLRAALAEFNIKIPVGRHLRLPFAVVNTNPAGTTTDERRPVGLLKVKTPKRQKVTTRATKTDPQAPQATQA